MPTTDQTLLSRAAERLLQSLQGGQTFEAAQVRVIGLDEIKEAAGADWEKLGARIRDSALHFIQGSVDDSDIVIPAGDGFLIIFAEAKGRDLNREMFELRQTLNAFFLGEEATRGLRASVRHEQISGHAASEAVQRAAAARPAPTRGGDVRFAPVWSVGREIIGAWFATPCTAEIGGLRYGYDPMFAKTGRNAVQDYLATDLAVLQRAIEGAEHVLSLGKRCVVGFSIHSTTLQHRVLWRAYEQRLRAAPAAVRPILAAKIAEIEPGATVAAMAEWVARIEPVTRHVSLGLHSSDHGMAGLESARAKTIAVSIGKEGFPNGDYRPQAMRAIDHWVRGAHRAGLVLSLDAPGDAPVLAHALSAKADLIASTALWPATPLPHGVKPMARNQAIAAFQELDQCGGAAAEVVTI